MPNRTTDGFNSLANQYEAEMNERLQNEHYEKTNLPVTVRMPEDLRDELDRLADHFDVSRGVLCRDILRVGADQMSRAALSQCPDDQSREELAIWLISGVRKEVASC